jgi:hypothetical protein
VVLSRAFTVINPKETGAPQLTPFSIIIQRLGASICVRFVPATLV